MITNLLLVNGYELKLRGKSLVLRKAPDEAITISTVPEKANCLQNVRAAIRLTEPYLDQASIANNVTLHQGKSMEEWQRVT